MKTIFVQKQLLLATVIAILLCTHWTHAMMYPPYKAIDLSALIARPECSTPLHGAVYHNCLEAVTDLLRKNNINAQASDGSTPLNIAIINNRAEIASFLLDHGANPNIPDHGGWTPLQHAAYTGNHLLVALLLQYGANPNIRGNQGWTALKSAVREEHFYIVSLLLRWKKIPANPNIADNDDYTPAHSATECNNLAILELLTKHGANLTLKNKDGQTPLNIAEDNMNDLTNVLPFLLKYTPLKQV